jgi:hypothetical protein
VVVEKRVPESCERSCTLKNIEEWEGFLKSKRNRKSIPKGCHRVTVGGKVGKQNYKMALQPGQRFQPEWKHSCWQKARLRGAFGEILEVVSGEQSRLGFQLANRKPAKVSEHRFDFEEQSF